MELRVKQDSERGIKILIEATEVAPAGTRITLFIEQTVNETRLLDGKAPVMNLGAPGGIIPVNPSIANLSYNMEQLRKSRAIVKVLEEGK